MPFISDYLLATSGNESPANFHKWSALSALSALAGRRFWLKLGPIVYYPNFYCVLVGDPGVKKSFAMDKAKDLIHAVGGIPMAATSTTKEAITKEMSSEKFRGKRFFKNPVDNTNEEYNQLAIFATEFTTFLGVAPTNMLDFLTAIYTEKVYDERYKNTGEGFFPGPYITMLACMTPEIVKGYLKLNILTGGFSRRTMFVWGTRGAPISRPAHTPEQIDAMARCVAWGKEIQNFASEITLTPAAWRWYEEWYDRNYATLTDRKPSVQAFFGTKHEFLFKVGMLFTIAETGKPEITAEQLDFLNQRFFAPVEENLERVFEGAGQNPEATVAAQVCRMLEALGHPMNKKQLLLMFGEQATSWNAMQDTLTHLCSVGRLAERTLSSNGQLLGSVVGTPDSFTNRTDSDLVAFLKSRPAVLLKEIDTGSTE